MQHLYQDDPLLNTGEAAQFLKSSAASLVSWRQQRKGPVYIKIGHKVFYRRSDLEAFIAANRRIPGNDSAL